MEDTKIAIKWVQTGLTFLKWVHTILLVGWAFGGLLTLFSNGILHITPLAYEIALRDVIGDSLGFGIDIEIRSKQRIINLIYFMLIVGIALNGTHIGFTIYELVTNDASPIFWFLIFFTCLLCVLLVVEVVYFYYFIKYKRYLGLLGKNK
jgi:hypothetical protein